MAVVTPVFSYLFFLFFDCGGGLIIIIIEHPLSNPLNINPIPYGPIHSLWPYPYSMHPALDLDCLRRSTDDF